MKLLDRAIVSLLPAVPRPVVQKLSARYIAGPTLADACRVVKALNERGKSATIDVLGEEVHNAGEAAAIAREYRDALAAIDEQGLRSGVSVKLTALGLKIDPALAQEHLEAVVRDAAERGRFVRIDMEDSSTTDQTLRMYRELRVAGYDNVGIVLQAYLKRTLADVRALADLKPNVRLVKGIYVEPPSIAFQDYDAVRASFARILTELVAGGSYVAVATHDEWLIRRALELEGEPDGLEFQMLLGVRENRAEELVAGGHRVRIYVPYGRHWYAYSLRRLQENPRIAGYVAADTVGRLLHR